VSLYQMNEPLVIRGRQSYGAARGDVAKRSIVTRLQWFAMVLFLFSIHFEEWDPFSTGISFIIPKFTIVLYTVVALLDGRRFFALKEIKYFLWPIAAYFVLTTVTSYLHRSPGEEKFVDVVVLLNILAFLLLTNHFRNDTRALRGGLGGFVWGGIVVTALFYSGFNLNYFQDRVALFGANQNEMGQRVAVTMILLMSLVLGKDLRSLMARYGTVLLLPFLAVFLIRTGSRMALLGMLAGMLAFFVLIGSHRNSTYVIKLVVGAFLCYAMWIYASTSEVMSHRLMEFLNEGDTSGRNLIWTKLSDLVWENPWFGMGKTGYAVETKRLFGEYTAPHNTLLQALFNGGIVGLALYVIFMGRIIVAGVKEYKRAGVILSISLLAQVLPMILVGDALDSKTCWFLLAYVASQSTKRQSSGSEVSPPRAIGTTGKRAHPN
jgi:O-antigen ligase